MSSCEGASPSARAQLVRGAAPGSDGVDGDGGRHLLHDQVAAVATVGLGGQLPMESRELTSPGNGRCEAASTGRWVRLPAFRDALGFVSVRSDTSQTTADRGSLLRCPVESEVRQRLVWRS
jgi:hypothetical protein